MKCLGYHDSDAFDAKKQNFTGMLGKMDELAYTKI